MSPWSGVCVGCDEVGECGGCRAVFGSKSPERMPAFERKHIVRRRGRFMMSQRCHYYTSSNLATSCISHTSTLATRHHRHRIMDTYDDPPNPFSTDPSPAPSRDEQATQGGGSSSGMLPPTQPVGSGSQAGGVAYPELDIYPSNANTNANTTIGFGGERGKLFGSDDNDDEDEGVKEITAGYPQLNLYPAVDTPNQESGPWSNSQAPLSSNSNSQPQAQFQPQSQSPNKPASSPPPPTYRPSFPNAGAGIKSYVGPRVKEEACCAMDEELQVRGGGIEVSSKDLSRSGMEWTVGKLTRVVVFSACVVFDFNPRWPICLFPSFLISKRHIYRSHATFATRIPCGTT